MHTQLLFRVALVHILALYVKRHYKLQTLLSRQVGLVVGLLLIVYLILESSPRIYPSVQTF